MSESRTGAGAALLLGTVGFALCFTVWGLIAPLAPLFRQAYGLSGKEVGLLVAVPVLLGSLARIPLGALTDRYGGRVMFAALLAFLALPLAGARLAGSYPALLAGALVLGVAGASFAIGVPFVSAWFSANRQGAALGVYGIGNIGTAVAALVAPRVANRFGWPFVFELFVPVVLVGAAVMWLAARDAPGAVRADTSFAARLAVIGDAPVSWLLMLFYFVTFGSFVAIGALLPTLLVSLYHLAPADAGARTAGFIVLATLVRPLGGLLSDRWGSPTVLNVTFAAVAALAVLLAFQPGIPGATVGYLGVAAAVGLGNGAVFKLVALRFPGQAGTVGGFVGAAGGLGGFFPPIVIGVVRDATGSTAIGMMLLSEFAVICFMLNVLVLQRGARRFVTGGPA